MFVITRISRLPPLRLTEKNREPAGRPVRAGAESGPSGSKVHGGTPVLSWWPGRFGWLPACQHFAATQTPAFLPPRWLGCPPECQVLLGVLCLVSPRRTLRETSVPNGLKQGRCSRDLSFTLGLTLPLRPSFCGGIPENMVPSGSNIFCSFRKMFIMGVLSYHLLSSAHACCNKCLCAR